MGDSTDGLGHGPEFWKKHVLAAETFSGSDQEYCRQNNLSWRKFSSYKVKLGFSKLKPHQAFVKINSDGPNVSPKVRSMPDPNWTAEFILALFNKK